MVDVPILASWKIMEGTEPAVSDLIEYFGQVCLNLYSVLLFLIAIANALR
jgi:hypothetical protein